MTFPHDYKIRSKKKIKFEEITDMGERCGKCNKKLIPYYNDDYEIFIDVCTDRKCINYSAYDFHERCVINVDLDAVELIGYFDK